MFGVVVIEGGTLKETLLLNLVVYKPEAEAPRTSMRDLPVWEEDRAPMPESAQRNPLGWTDLLVWSSRRVWLSPRRDGDETVVDQVVITPGTRLLKQESLPDYEWMAAFRRPRMKKGAKFGSLERIPIRLEGRRGIWRHSQDLLLAAANDVDDLRPKTLKNISEMVRREYIDKDAVYTLRVFGQQLDSKGAVVQATLEDAVAAPVSLIRAEDGRVGMIVGIAIKLADDVGLALRDLEREYHTKLSAKPPTDLDLTYWSLLPVPFDAFLRGLGKSVMESERERQERTSLKQWEAAVARIAGDVAQLWVESPSASGRQVLTIGEMYGRFLGQLAGLRKQFNSRAAKVTDMDEENEPE
jgi:CRISPR system Cascade subunit CasA